MDIQKSIEAYQPYNEQEGRDKAVMLSLLAAQPDLFSRENQVAHMTASSWLLNRTHDKVLMIYHKINRSGLRGKAGSDGGDGSKRYPGSERGHLFT